MRLNAVVLPRGSRKGYPDTVKAIMRVFRVLGAPHNSKLSSCQIKLQKIKITEGILIRGGGGTDLCDRLTFFN